jgi:nucleoside-diphosphate-sugar epimerase
VLRTSRFFPEEDDNEEVRTAFSDENLKANEYLYRRVDLEDVVSAHLLAAERARELGFRKYIVSATTPFRREDLDRLRCDAPGVVRDRVQEYEIAYRLRSWKMLPGIERVYVNERARKELGWLPRYDFESVIRSIRAGADFISPLARSVGSKGYHDTLFSQGPYPVE